MSSIGVISDTHGLLRPAALEALAGTSLIVHAGDIGDPAILDRLSQLAPLVAVRGNVDTGEWARRLPQTAEAEVERVRLYVLHDLHQLTADPEAAGYHIVISGHSHKPIEKRSGGVLYLNPGSAGPRRFKLPICLARVHTSEASYRVEFVSVG